MKEIKLQKIVSLFLCLVLMAGLFSGFTSVAYATELNTECELNGIEFTKDGESVGAITSDESAYTITLPEGTALYQLDQIFYLKFNVSEGASVKRTEGNVEWPEEGKAYGGVLNTEYHFTVTAEDGEHTKEYTVKLIREPYTVSPKINNGGFKFNINEADAWTITVPEVDESGAVNNDNTETFSSADVTIEQLDPVTTASGGNTNIKIGRIVINYGDRLLLKPTTAPIKKNEASIVSCDLGDETRFELFRPASVTQLNSGKKEFRVFRSTVNSSEYFNYDIVVVGNNYVGNYPHDSWTVDESAKTITIAYDENIDYSAYSISGLLVPTWGVSMDKTVLDLTGGSDTITFTNQLGNTATYTVHLKESNELSVTFNHTCLVQNSLAIAFKVGGVDWSDYSDIYLHIERQAYAKNDPECTWKTEDIMDYTIDDLGRCVFTYSGISAAEMGDQIKATVFATKDGKEYVSDTDTYSIATYAYNTLENYKDNEALRTLLVDMLNYGSEAQSYFGKNVSNLVNASLTDTQKAWGTPGSISYENCKADGTFAGSTARVSSRSLVLEETVKLKAYLTFDTTPGSNVKVVFRYTAASGQEKVTEVNSKDFVYDSAKNRYSAMLTTIAPPDFKKPISIKIYDGSTQISAEYTYSVESYAYSASQWEGSQYDTLKTLVSAMIKYSRSAETYFQQIQ